MTTEKSQDEIIEEWWESLSSYEQVRYLKMYVPRVFNISHEVKMLCWTQVFQQEELKLQNPK